MAPRRGGSSGGSGGSGVSCPNAFSNDFVYSYTYRSTAIAYFASYCVFFTFTLGILIALCSVRKRHSASKRLIGPVYIVSLLFLLIAYALVIIATMLRECETTPYYSYYNWTMAYGIFFKLGYYLLLVAMVWSVNMLLRERLGSGRGVYKALCLTILVVMGALTCGFIGLTSYNTWTVTPSGSDSLGDGLYDEANKFGTAYFILYLFSVVVSGALSIVTLVSMRSKSIPVGGLLGWVIALFLCMFIWTLIMVVEYGLTLPGSTTYISRDAFTAMDWLIYFFQTFSFIAILLLARSKAWNNALVQPLNPNMYPNQTYPQQPMPYGGGVPPPAQQQYAYNGQPGQQYYYQQQPVYNGQVQNGAAPMNGNGHMVQVK